jgi:tRNA(adenine34) deaminase
MKPEAAKNVKHTPLTPEEDKIYMKKALKQAEHALALGEVPIGCVIVYDKKIIGRGFNKRNTKKTALAHAEITAIAQACRNLGDWRLDGCTMYITLEPCQMCSGAIVQSRIDRIVIGAMNPKAGCAGSILNLLNRPEFNHQVEITKDICAAESTEILQRFFKDLRVRNKT